MKKWPQIRAKSSQSHPNGRIIYTTSCICLSPHAPQTTPHPRTEPSWVGMEKDGCLWSPVWIKNPYPRSYATREWGENLSANVLLVERIAAVSAKAEVNACRDYPHLRNRLHANVPTFFFNHELYCFPIVILITNKFIVHPKNYMICIFSIYS